MKDNSSDNFILYLCASNGHQSLFDFPYHRPLKPLQIFDDDVAIFSLGTNAC